MIQSSILRLCHEAATRDLGQQFYLLEPQFSVKWAQEDKKDTRAKLPPGVAVKTREIKPVKCLARRRCLGNMTHDSCFLFLCFIFNTYFYL